MRHTITPRPPIRLATSAKSPCCSAASTSEPIIAMTRATLRPPRIPPPLSRDDDRGRNQVPGQPTEQQKRVRHQDQRDPDRVGLAVGAGHDNDADAKENAKGHAQHKAVNEIYDEQIGTAADVSERGGWQLRTPRAKIVERRQHPAEQIEPAGDRNQAYEPDQHDLGDPLRITRGPGDAVRELVHAPELYLPTNAKTSSARSLGRDPAETELDPNCCSGSRPGGDLGYLSSCREITTRWIWFVPS